ncbi:acetylglutamate kinase [Melghirimyces algeriensis]|uniref:Acetylglutamate kinase n=1 Tax=Melghirimyces algeriensis TaxID=910412 RepID=A0A521D4U5_9BACL|nr:acetylglutamate kinase [Melghirimyces algeriensis]SMO66111.1 N-acetylglutamate kinase [Melghirimyces algeriensis]
MRVQPVVIKVGGSVLETLHSSFFQDCGHLLKKGFHPVVVHGGGPEISRLQERLGLTPQFCDGLRVTDDQGLKVAEMVLAGSVNKQLAAMFQTAGFSALGLSGVDGGLLSVRQKDPKLGWVGEVSSVCPAVLYDLIDRGWIPIVASLGMDSWGQRYNVNADSVAGAIAQALSAERLFMVTDVPGIMKGDRVLSQVTPTEVQTMIQKGIIQGGMVPKVKAALEAVETAVHEVVIVDGSASGCLMNTGTRIRKEVKTHGLISHLSAE